MVDPKYANLPGIDLESPDVYETDDLPEDDQAGQKQRADEESESVEKLHVDVVSARERFKGKEIAATDVDFSDRIRRGRNTGYDIIQTEYEIVGEGTGIVETPQQKYQRLQHEIRELVDEVNTVKASVKDDSLTEKLSPVTTGQQIEYIQHQLTDLHLEKLLGQGAKLDLADPQGALRKRLLTQLESYKPAAQAGADKSSGKASAAPLSAAAASVSYELHYKPEQAQFSKNARMASLDERLERLEAVIGQNTDKLALLTTDVSNKSLLGAVASLSTKLSLLDLSQLDQVEGRLQNVISKLSDVDEKQASDERSEKLNKVSELYEVVRKWETFSSTLPHLVDRMTALKDLHEKALQFSQALTHLDTAQQEISGTLNIHSDMMKQLQATFKQNTDMITENVKSLENRIKKLPGQKK